MQREIVDVRRCNRCQEVVQALVLDCWNVGTKDETQAYFWLPRRAHSATDCDMMLRQAAEEWPRLFEMER